MRNGYATFAVGKWHLAPATEMTPRAGRATAGRCGRASSASTASSPARPTSTTPTSSTTTIRSRPPRTPEEGYHLTEDLADHAIQLPEGPARATRDKPFFLYFAPGACHAPHQAPASYIEPLPRALRHGLGRVARAGVRASGRERARCRRAPSSPSGRRGCRRGTTLSADERRLYARMMEVYAGLPDAHRRRRSAGCSTFIERLGELDNTIVIVMSDNGASAEGGPQGLVQRAVLLQLRAREPRGEPAPHRRPRHAARQQPLPVGMGVGGQHAAQAVQARHARGRRVRSADRALAARGSGGRGETRQQYVHAIDVAADAARPARHRAAARRSTASRSRRSTA